MDPKRERWWAPDYRTNQGLVTIQGTSSSECPVSYITGFSKEVLRISYRASNIEHIQILGDGSELPSKFVDALEVIAMEKAEVNEALRIEKAVETPDVEES